MIGLLCLNKSTARIYGDKKIFLGCVIGHELSNIICNDHFKKSIKLSKQTKELDNFSIRNKCIIKNNSEVNNDKSKNIDYEKIFLYEELFSRESEMDADQNGRKIMLKAS